jgi:hypothetical protein
MATYESFESFARAVQDLHFANPTWVRLNGEGATGDQNAWGYFKHADRTWKVDADTHILPIVAALDYFRRTGTDPFEMGSTPNRDKLLLSADVCRLLVQQHPRYQDGQYMYIYSPRQK